MYLRSHKCVSGAAELRLRAAQSQHGVRTNSRQGLLVLTLHLRYMVSPLAPPTQVRGILPAWWDGAVSIEIDGNIDEGQ